MIVERHNLGKHDGERKESSPEEQIDSVFEPAPDGIEEIWEWDGSSWKRVS